MRYDVTVTGLDGLGAQDKQVIFHGVNKSGSLVLTKVLHEAYHHDVRANQFFSTYVGVPRTEKALTAIVAHASGHGFFGAHYLYGAVRLDPERQVMTTQFRNPLPRVRSCYQWLRNKASANGEVYPDFESWVLSTRGVRHSQVAQFGLGFGEGHDHALEGADPEALFESSVRNIERDVQWFGIAEYFEESAFCMAALCGLSSIAPWQRDDRNADRPLVGDWPPEQIELVKEIYRWDFKLYEWALGTFHARLSQLTFGPELTQYKDACRGQYKDRLDARGVPLA